MVGWKKLLAEPFGADLTFGPTPVRRKIEDAEVIQLASWAVRQYPTAKVIQLPDNINSPCPLCIPTDMYHCVTQKRHSTRLVLHASYFDSLRFCTTDFIELTTDDGKLVYLEPCLDESDSDERHGKGYAPSIEETELTAAIDEEPSSENSEWDMEGVEEDTDSASSDYSSDDEDDEEDDEESSASSPVPPKKRKRA